MDIKSSKRLATLLEKHSVELDNTVGWLRDVSHGEELKYHIEKISHLLAINGDVLDKLYTEHPESKTLNSKHK